MTKRQRNICEKLPLATQLISVEPQEMPKGWIHQHRLIGVCQIEFTQLCPSTGLPNSFDKLIELLVGDPSFFWTNQRVN